MRKHLAQLEFAFGSWIRKSSKPEKKPIESSDAPSDTDTEMTTWCREQANTLRLPTLACRVCVVWNPRMRTTAGRAHWPDRRIELNPKVKAISNEEVWRTLKHEFAHLIAYERNGRRKIQPHGIEWRNACSEIGIPGESACHTLPLKARKMKRKYRYSCPACTSKIERVRPFKRAVACHECCNKFSKGKYHDRFRLIRTKI